MTWRRSFDGDFGYQGSPQGEEEHGKYSQVGQYRCVYARLRIAA